MNKELITISKISKNKKYWLNKQFINEKLNLKISQADILLIPNENFRDTVSFSFTHEAENIYFYLQKNLPNEVSIEICVGDDFQVLALHADIKRMGTFLVTNVGLPILISLLASYIDRNYISNTAPVPIVNNITINQHTTVNTTINVELEENNIISISYEGPAKDFQEYMNNTVKELNASK